MCFPPRPLAVPCVLNRCERIPRWKGTSFVFTALTPFRQAQSRYASLPYMEGGIFPVSVVAWLRAHGLCGAFRFSPREVHLPPPPHLHFGLRGLPGPHFVVTRGKVDMLWEGRAADPPRSLVTLTGGCPIAPGMAAGIMSSLHRTSPVCGLIFLESPKLRVVSSW